MSRDQPVRCQILENEGEAKSPAKGWEGDRDPPLPWLSALSSSFPYFTYPTCLCYARDSSSQRGEKSEISSLDEEKNYNIDLTSPIVRVFFTLKVENYGASEVSEILIAFSPSEFEHLVILKASTVEGKRKKKAYIPLSVSPVSSPNAPDVALLFSIAFRSPLKSGETKTVETLYVLTHSLEPFPTEISQSESQFVYYRDSATTLSPYTIVEQTVYIKTPSSRVEAFMKVEPTTHSSSEIRYGPYRDCPPYSFSPVIVHFENNNQFAVVEELVL